MKKFYEIICRKNELKKLNMKNIDKFDYIQIIPIGQGDTMSTNSPK